LSAGAYIITLCQSRVCTTWRPHPNRTVKFLAAYLSTTLLLIEWELKEGLSGGFPVLKAGDLKAKHPDYSSRPTTAKRSPCVIMPAKPPAPFMGRTPLSRFLTNPMRPPPPDVFAIVVVKDFVLPVHLTVCSAIRSDHYSVLIVTACQTSFQNTFDSPNFTRMD
jgi:hypothetical protein